MPIRYRFRAQMLFYSILIKLQGVSFRFDTHRDSYDDLNVSSISNQPQILSVFAEADKDAPSHESLIVQIKKYPLDYVCISILFK